MRKVLIAVMGLVSVIVCSCGSKTKGHTVTFRALTESFRIVPDAAERQYSGQLLSVPIRPEQITADGNVISLSLADGMPTCITFHFAESIVVPPKERFVITGICGKRIHDGIYRGLGCNFSLSFTNCTIE